MIIIKKIFKVLLILLIVINSIDIYGTNLKYQGYRQDVLGNGNTGIKIKSMTQASEGSVSSYATRPKVAGRMDNS